MSILTPSEGFLTTHGERYWGYIIYRTDYSSDSDFERALKRLHESFFNAIRYELHDAVLKHRTPNPAPCEKVIGNYQPEVMSDPQKFDNMSLDNVREHFSAMMAEREARQVATVKGPFLDIQAKACIVLDKEGITSILAHESNNGQLLEPQGIVKVVDAEYDAESNPDAQIRKGVDPMASLAESIRERDVPYSFPYHGWINVRCEALFELYAELRAMFGLEEGTKVDENNVLVWIP